MSIIINDELCTGCATCVNACPYGGIELIDNVAVITGDCNLCGACVDSCPVEAIVLEKEVYVDKVDKTQFKGVWIIGEHYKGELHKVCHQLITKGKELANLLRVKTTIVILAYELNEDLVDLGQYGADEVLFVKSPVLKHYYSDIYVNILTELIKKHKPEIILIGATPTGRDFAPRIAKRLNAGLTADCTGLDIEEESKNLRQTRPTFGGNIMATIRTPNSRPQMATVRPGIFAAKKDYQKKASIIQINQDLQEKDSVTKIVKIINKQISKVNIEDAEIIVAGGRGIGTKDNFKLIKELADVLGAEMAGSRVTIELDWLDPERQVGQTGKTVSPKLYIACGISGAIQHVVGMENSEIIVAINKDPNAPIFHFAHYGIVGDLNQVIPALIEEIRKIKAEENL
jgi:electron transfer flavoprotein alpha subunit/NAD-dependent dihydropyrimidine dehydrogenase PreA subunit